MKQSQFIGLMLIACIPIGIIISNLFASTTTVENEVQDEVVLEQDTVEVIEEVNVVDAAKAELERINGELDAEEARLLEDKKAIEAELEKVRETRASFR